MTLSVDSISLISSRGVFADKFCTRTSAKRFASQSLAITRTNWRERSDFISSDKSGSSSIVSWIRQSKYALATARSNIGGSCGMVRAKVLETPSRMSF